MLPLLNAGLHLFYDSGSTLPPVHRVCRSFNCARGCRGFLPHTSLCYAITSRPRFLCPAARMAFCCRALHRLPCHLRYCFTLRSSAWFATYARCRIHLDLPVPLPVACAVLLVHYAPANLQSWFCFHASACALTYGLLRSATRRTLVATICVLQHAAVATFARAGLPLPRSGSQVSPPRPPLHLNVSIFLLTATVGQRTLAPTPAPSPFRFHLRAAVLVLYHSSDAYQLVGIGWIVLSPVSPRRSAITRLLCSLTAPNTVCVVSAGFLSFGPLRFELHRYHFRFRVVFVTLATFFASTHVVSDFTRVTLNTFLLPRAYSRYYRTILPGTSLPDAGHTASSPLVSLPLSTLSPTAFHHFIPVPSPEHFFPLPFAFPFFATYVVGSATTHFALVSFLFVHFLILGIHFRVNTMPTSFAALFAFTVHLGLRLALGSAFRFVTHVLPVP